MKIHRTGAGDDRQVRLNSVAKDGNNSSPSFLSKNHYSNYSNPSKRIILFKIKLIKRIYSRIYYDEILKMTLKKIERYPNKEEKFFQLFLCCIITVLDYVIHV